MNYREKIRKAIECPQFGNERYGEWGALNLQQRTLIKRLLDELDSAYEYIKNIFLENQKLRGYIEYLDECNSKDYKGDISYGNDKKIKILTIDDLEKAFKESVYKNQVNMSQVILDNYFKGNKDE